MKIAYISGAVIPSPTANSVHVMKMCRALSKASHDVVLIARRQSSGHGNPFKHYGVDACFQIKRFPRLPVNLLDGIAYPLRALHYTTQVARPDIVYSRHLPSAVLASSCCSVVFEAHTPPTRVQRLLLTRLFHQSRFLRLVLITRVLRQEYAASFPYLPANKVVVAPDAADPPEPWSAPGPLPPRTRFRVGYIGQLYPGKGMEIVADLAPRMPDVEFHVIGGKEPDLTFWRKRTSNCENLVFHGYIAPGELDPYRTAMDALVAPYQRRVEHAGGSDDIGKWMSPLKLFEYMAARKPIVASDLPVLREIIRNGEEALLVPPDDIEAWVRALRALIEDDELREALASRAFEQFDGRFTWERRARVVTDGLPSKRSSHLG